MNAIQSAIDTITGVLLCGICAALPVLFILARVREWAGIRRGAWFSADDTGTYYQERK